MDNDIIESLKYFDCNYDVIASYNLNGNHDIILGNKDQRICRFCGRKSPAVTFRNDAHAVPHLLGNDILYTYYECDECNSKFASTLDNHLGNYLSMWRTFSRIKGKRGIPKYKKGDTKIFVDSNRLNIHEILGKEIVSFNDDAKTIMIEGIRDSYIPIAVYKCFVKMALSIMPEEELDEVRWAIEWISEEDHSKSRFHFKPLNLFLISTPGTMPYPFISTCLFRRKKELEREQSREYTVPYMIFVIRFANYLFQVMLVDFNKNVRQINTEVKYKYLCFPKPYDDDYTFGKSICSCEDFSSKEMKKGEKVCIEMHYEEKLEDESVYELAKEVMKKTNSPR